MQYFDDNGEPIVADERTPVDFLEPLAPHSDLRGAAIAWVRIMSLAMSYIADATDSTAAAYGVAIALGLTSVVENRTQSDIARELGVSRKAISHHARTFCRMTQLPPSKLMRDDRP